MPHAQSQQQHSRINISELKALITKKLGPDRSSRYFNCLNRFLSQKLGKAEYDKICSLTLGRENVPLHNQLIGSILKNACHGQVPPPVNEKVPQSVKVISKGSPKTEEGPPATQSPVPPPRIWSNGDVFPVSPRKSRSVIRDRKSKERRSPLGCNGKVSPLHPLIADAEDVGKCTPENGDWNSCDLQRPMQLNQGIAEHPEDDQEISLLHPTKRARLSRPPPAGVVPVHSKCPVGIVAIQDEKEAEQPSFVNSTRGPLQAPLGIPFCSASVGGARRSLPLTTSSVNYANSVDCSELPDTESLKKRMEQIAGMMGLNGVSVDCANLLNYGLDMYLKRLIKDCVDHVGGKSVEEAIRHPTNNFSADRNPINGILPGYHLHAQCSGDFRENTSEPKNPSPVSLQRFRAAMELKPQQLGEDWPLLLEKICLRSWEE